MIKKLFSVSSGEKSIQIAILILRVSVAILMIPHGYQKMINFEEIQGKFINFAGLGQSFSLGLTIFAELFCSAFLLLGLFTRLSLIPLIVTMLVAAFNAHSGEIFGDGQTSFMYAVIYICLWITGPGRLSLDDYFFKNRA